MSTSDREKRLEAALRYVSEMFRRGHGPVKERAEAMDRIAREALDDDAAGGSDKHKWDREGERCVKCGAKDWMDAPCHPPQRREALEALERIKSRWVEACDGHEASLQAMRADVEAVRRHLTAPPTVPEAVRRLPDELRSDARKIRSLPGGNYRRGQADAHECISVTLERALAQHSEPGRIPEGYCLVPVEPTEAMIKAAEGVEWENGSGLTLKWVVAPKVYRAMLAAAPEPDEQKCGWAMDDEGYYQTDCGTEFEMVDFLTLEEMPSMKYCANCGRRIRDDSPAPDADERE